MTVNTDLLSSLVAATTSNSFMWLGANDYQPLVDAGYAETNATVPGAPEGQLATRATPAGIAFSQNPTNPAETASGFGTAPQLANAPASNPVSDPNATNASAVSSVGVSSPVADTAGAAITGGFTPAAEKKPVFTFVSDFQPPEPKARTREAVGADEKYPFADLKAPTKKEDGSFDYTGAVIFVPSTNYSAKDKQGKTGLRSPEDMAFSLQSACSAAERRYANVTGTKPGTDGKTRKTYDKTRTFKTAPATQNGTPGAYIYRAS